MLVSLIYAVIYLFRLGIAAAAIYVGYNYAFPNTFGFIHMSYPAAFCIAICINIVIIALTVGKE